MSNSTNDKWDDFFKLLIEGFSGAIVSVSMFAAAAAIVHNTDLGFGPSWLIAIEIGLLIVGGFITLVASLIFMARRMWRLPLSRWFLAFFIAAFSITSVHATVALGHLAIEEAKSSLLG